MSQADPIARYTFEAQPLHDLLRRGLIQLSGFLLKRTIAGSRAIVDYEPRIDAASIQVKAIPSDSPLERNNIVAIEIRGLLWAQPIPLELLLRTEVDLESGSIEISERSTG